MATTRLFLRIWSERAVSRSLRFSLIPNAGTRSTPSLISQPLSRSGASITVVLPSRLDHMGSEGKGRGYRPPERIVVGNGAAELIKIIAGMGRKLVVSVPSFNEYANAGAAGDVIEFALD